MPPGYAVKEIGPEELPGFVAVYAAVSPAYRPHINDLAASFAQQLATGGRMWVIGRDGQKPVGYAILDAVPGLPGVHDLQGGVVAVGRRRGLGAMLLEHVRAAAIAAGVGRLSARVEALEDETATFMLRRGFSVEHEEVLLERENFAPLPPIPADPPGDLVTYPRERAIREFCRVYQDSFAGTPWSQPYSEPEVDETLTQPENLLFIEVNGKAVGVAWHESMFNCRGRVEPLGIVPAYQRGGYGRRLLLAALHNLRQEFFLEIGTWRQNTAALNLYESLGFLETQNWYYLACDLDGLKAE
jgi:ribosomal protein S18 acetylase RimI-like enzyme